MLEFNLEQFQFLTKDILFKCCHEQDHTFKGYMSWINSQNGSIVNIGHFNNTQFVQYGEQVYPGGKTEFDFNGKILIEFTHYDTFEKVLPEWRNSSFLALEEIQQSDFLPENYQLMSHNISNDILSNLSDQLIYDILNPVDT